MRKQTLLSSGLILVLVLVFLPYRSVVTAGGFDWASIAAEESVDTTEVDNPNDTTSDAPQKKKGNGFVRVLSAPFRAIGRLFGGGKKNDQQARRITDKEAAKFESAKITRVKDARSDAQDAATKNAQDAATKNASQPATNQTPVVAYIQKGRELLIAGDVNGAISELTNATAIDSRSGEANELLGIAYENKGLRDRALEAFELAVDADENNAEYLNNYGFLLFKNGDYEKATKYLKRAAKKSPKDARIWNNLGLVYSQRQKFDDAYESFVKAVGEYDGHMNMATQLQQRGYGKAAIKHLEQAQALRPNSADVLNRLVSLYEQTGRATDAESARRALVALKTFADGSRQ